MIDPSNIFARARLVQMRHVTGYSPAKTGKYLIDIPQFSKLRLLRKTFEG